jgi:hypothetical protein
MSENSTTISAVIEALVGIYRRGFSQNAGARQIKGVEPARPENVTSWPILYFALNEFRVVDGAFAAALPSVQPNPRPLAFGQMRYETKSRRSQLIDHEFVGQLLVTPRRNLPQDDLLARQFVDVMIPFQAENATLGGLVEKCFITGGRFGIFTIGTVADIQKEFLGIEFNFTAQFWA